MVTGCHYKPLIQVVLPWYIFVVEMWWRPGRCRTIVSTCRTITMHRGIIVMRPKSSLRLSRDDVPVYQVPRQGIYDTLYSSTLGTQVHDMNHHRETRVPLQSVAVVEGQNPQKKEYDVKDPYSITYNSCCE